MHFCIVGFLSLRHPLEVNLLKADESTLDFGQRWTHDIFEWKVKLRNQSNTNLTIERVESSCNCTAFLQADFNLPADGVLELPFRIAPSLDQAADSVRRFQSNIAVFVRDHRTPAKFQIHGTLHRLATLEPDELYFGRVFQEECTSTSRELVLRSHIPLSNVSVIDLDQLPFNVRISSDSPTLDCYRINASPKPDGAIGEFDIRLCLNCVVRDESLAPPPPIRVRFTGEIVGDVASNPTRFDLGVVRSPQIPPLELRLASRSSRRFTVSEDRIRRPSFLDPLIVAGSEKSPGFYILAPIVLSEPGYFKDELVIPIEFDDGQQSCVRVPICGFYSRASAVNFPASTTQ